jgi:D-glycero-D-manno-heptose 1,7-bisphosphate phosphatase
VGVGDERLRAAVFLDRDGVIVEPVPDVLLGSNESPYHAQDVALVAGAVEGIRALRDQGFLLVGVSNQPAAAKANATLEQLYAVHARTAQLLAAQGASLDEWRYCFHHPAGVDPRLGVPCDCRKPAPGLLLAAAEQHAIDLARSWMVGDSDSDVAAGVAAGTRTVLVEHPGSRHRRHGTPDATFTATDLRTATSAIAGRSLLEGESQ